MANKPSKLALAQKIFEDGGWYSALDLEKALWDRYLVKTTTAPATICDLRKHPRYMKFEKRKNVVSGLYEFRLVAKKPQSPPSEARNCPVCHKLFYGESCPYDPEGAIREPQERQGRLI